MIDAPKIDTSSENERRIFIKDKYPCIADCDMCGLCKVFHGKDPENAYDDYIKGIRSFADVSDDYKNINLETTPIPQKSNFVENGE